MEIVIKLTEQDLKDNIVVQSLKSLIGQNKTIKAPQVEIEDLLQTHQQKTLKSTENTQKSKGKTKEERVQDLKNYANSIYKDLSDAKKKSLKKFVEFYTDKIEKENFTINVENQLKKWFERDKNLK